MNLLYKGSLDVALDRALACTDQYLISHIHQPHIELAGGTIGKLFSSLLLI